MTTVVYKLDPVEDDTGIPQRIKDILAKHGWTARELARRAGLGSETHISLIVRRGGEGAKLPTLRKIAKAAGVRVEWLATGEGSPEADHDQVDAPHEDEGHAPALTPTRDPPSPEDHGVGRPLLRTRADWPELVEGAIGLDHDERVPRWVYDKLGETRETFEVEPNPSLILDLAKVLMKYVRPPPRPRAAAHRRS